MLANQLQKQKNLIQKRYKNNDGSHLFLNPSVKKSEQVSSASTGHS